MFTDYNFFDFTLIKLPFQWYAKTNIRLLPRKRILRKTFVFTPIFRHNPFLKLIVSHHLYKYPHG